MLELGQAIREALIHFVWQGALAAILLWVCLFVLRQHSANARYLASCIVFVLLTAAPLVTVLVIHEKLLGMPTNAWLAAALSQETVSAANISSSLRLGQQLSDRLYSWILPAWALGVLIFSARLAYSWKHVSILRRSTQPATGPLLITVTRLCNRMGLAAGAVRFRISQLIDGPAATGWIRPMILLPATILSLPAAQLEAIIWHELAHIRRHDYILNVMQLFVETLFFYHPAVWWISMRIRQERELCCDDIAVSFCGDACCYARSLLVLEKSRTFAAALPVQGSGGDLMARVRRLVCATPETTRLSKLPAILASIIVLCCAALNLDPAKAQQQPAETKTPALEFRPPADAPGVRVDIRDAPLLHRASVSYPELAIKNHVQGSVLAEVLLTANGNVSDARILTGPEELRRSVLESILRWHFSPRVTQGKQLVQVEFSLPPMASTKALSPVSSVEGNGRGEKSMEQKVESHDLLQGEDKVQARIRELEMQALAAHEQRKDLSEFGQEITALRERLLVSGFAGRVLSKIEMLDLPVTVREQILAQLPLRVGDMMSPESIEATRQVVARVDEHLKCVMTWSGDNGAILNIVGTGRQ